jgi:hypothetical protein
LHEGGRLVTGLAKMGPVGLTEAAYAGAKDAYDLATGKKKADYEHFEDMAAGAVNFDKQRFNQNVQQGQYGKAAINVISPVAQAVAGARIGVKEGVIPEKPIPTPELPSPRGALAGRMAEVPPGEQFSRAEVYNAAKQNGVTLDLAQATEHPLANTAKKANQYSLAARSKYEKAQNANTKALEGWADKDLSAFSKETPTRESLGPAIQNKLKQNVGEMEKQSGRILDELTRDAGDTQPNAKGIYQLADGIVNAEKGYYAKNPNLKPGKAWSIIEKLANRSKELKGETRLVESKVLDESGKPILREVQTKPQVTPDTWSDLHKLRSDLMNEYRNNPEIVGSRAEGWLKQMVAAIDDTMTSEAFSKLSPEQVAKFREANQIYADMKNTYDNPQSPFYHAVRAQSPSQVPAMLTRTPELAKQAHAIVGDLKGPLQRQYAESLLNHKDGTTRDFANLYKRISGIQEDVLSANLGTEGARKMKLLAAVARKVVADNNPSGTAKTAVPAAEFGGLFTHTPAAITELGAQYVGGRAINSQKLIDYLTMKPSEALKLSPRTIGRARGASGPNSRSKAPRK